MNPPPKLLDQVRDKLRVKQHSIRTEQAYVDWIKRFILPVDNDCSVRAGVGATPLFLNRFSNATQKVGVGDTASACLIQAPTCLSHCVLQYMHFHASALDCAGG